MADDPATRFRENVTEITAMVVTGVWLALMFLPFGTNVWLPVMLFGYVVVVPLVALLFGDEQDRQAWWEWTDDESATETETDATSPGTSEPNPEPADDPGEALATLRERYAAGELTDAQFERKLEQLLATETLADADRWRRAAREDRDRALEGEPDRDLEYDT